MSSFRPKVLCWIIAQKIPENYGKVVELVQFVGPVPFMQGEDWWHVVSRGVLVSDGPGPRKLAPPGTPLGVRQINLVPINDPDLDVGEVENDSIPAPIYANIKAHT